MPGVTMWQEMEGGGRGEFTKALPIKLQKIVKKKIFRHETCTMIISS